MKLFISWSGERSKALALALKDWIPLVLHYADPWLSEADIEAGQRWAEAVAKELEVCNFGIICITRENLNSPWILFEAGALAKSLQGGRVIPLLLDLDFREITGPLAQFQAKKIEKAGVLEMIQSLNQLAQQSVPEERYKQLFEALWPELEKKISALPKQNSPTKQSRPQNEVLEELVTAVRTMEARVRDSHEEVVRPSRRRSRFHPMMIHELGHMLSEKPGDPINILLAASVFRDDVPWLYELGMEAYRLSNSGSQKSRAAIEKFLRAVELARKGPFPMDEFGIDKASHMMLRELEFMLQHEGELLKNKESPLRRKLKTD